jgi:predicted RNA-binding protein with PUA domain
MKIAICGSMKLCKKMIEIKSELEKLGNTVILPRHTEEYADLNTFDHIHNESVKNKINHDLIRDYFREIEKNDAILVINENLNGVENYIGGNSFLEIGFAHVLDKKIFLLNPIPEIGYKDEILAMQPVVIKGDLKKIVN